MMIIALYILYNEILQLSNTTFSEYFSDPYNWIDLGPPLLLLYLKVLENTGHLNFAEN